MKIQVVLFFIDIARTFIEAIVGLCLVIVISDKSFELYKTADADALFLVLIVYVFLTLFSRVFHAR